MENWKFDLKYVEKWGEKILKKNGNLIYNLSKKIWKDFEKVNGKTFRIM